MKYLGTFILLLMLTAAHAASINYEKLLRKQPGNTDLYCAWIDQLLQERDTTAAEEKMAYVKKMNSPAPCILIQQAKIAVNRGRNRIAALHYAEAICLGYEVEGDSLFAALALSERNIIVTKLQHAQSTTKFPDAVKNALKAIPSSAAEKTLLTDTLVAAGDTIRTDSILYKIAYSRVGDQRELFVKINGLRCKLVVDSTATEPSISDVETQFLRKNEYIRQDEILEGRTHLVLREISFAEGMVLRNIRVRYKKNQEQPLIVPLAVFQQIGQAELDDTENVVTIYQTTNKQ